MQDFIQQAMGALGTSQATTSAATGGLLGYLQKNGPTPEVEQLLDALPGARSLLASEKPSGGGLMGTLGSAASALGVKSGGAAGLIGALQMAGLGADHAPRFVALFLEYAKAKAGPDLVNRILGAVPGLTN